jgi:hypothetical protein
MPEYKSFLKEEGRGWRMKDLPNPFTQSMPIR